MLFEAGKTGNPRRRSKGCCGGRIRAVAGLDRLLARKKNQQALIAEEASTRERNKVDLSVK